jgi:DNA (cytosine-5)-methyltransferase 1
MTTHLDLFSGIGGFALAAKWAGYQTVGFCEREDYPRRVLARHWPGVQCHRDIRDLDGSAYHGVNLITGGFPCQPFSVAGQQAGKADDRYLWPEMLRIIAQAQPAWVVAENVAGIVTLALDQMLSDLEGEGYACGTVVLPACSVDAPHRRDRVWIVAHANSHSEPDSTQHVRKGERMVANTDSSGMERPWSEQQAAGSSRTGEDVGNSPHLRRDWGTTDIGQTGQTDKQDKPGPEIWSEPSGPSEDVANTSSDSTQGVESGTQPGRHQRPTGLHGGAGSAPGPDWWEVEPPVGRVAHGIPRRVDRLRGLGNAIVPQVAYQILSLLVAHET